MRCFICDISKVNEEVNEMLHMWSIQCFIRDIFNALYVIYLVFLCDLLNRSHILHMKHWVDHVWSIECTTYRALSILHMKHWIDCIWSTEYTIYEALDILHIKH